MLDDNTSFTQARELLNALDGRSAALLEEEPLSRLEARCYSDWISRHEHHAIHLCMGLSLLMLAVVSLALCLKVTTPPIAMVAFILSLPVLALCALAFTGVAHFAFERLLALRARKWLATALAPVRESHHADLDAFYCGSAGCKTYLDAVLATGRTVRWFDYLALSRIYTASVPAQEEALTPCLELGVGA